MQEIWKPGSFDTLLALWVLETPGVHWRPYRITMVKAIIPFVELFLRAQEIANARKVQQRDVPLTTR